MLARKVKRAIRQKNLDALGDALRPPDACPNSDHIQILGPYRNRDKWRVILVDGKERKSLCVLCVGKHEEQPGNSGRKTTE